VQRLLDDVSFSTFIHHQWNFVVRVADWTNDIFSQWNFVVRSRDWLRLKSVRILFTVILWINLSTYEIKTREESFSELLQHQADFHPEIRIALLPNRAPSKAEMYHSFQNPSKLPSASRRIKHIWSSNVPRQIFVCHPQTVTPTAPFWLDAVKQWPVGVTDCSLTGPPVPPTSQSSTSVKLSTYATGYKDNYSPGCTNI